MPGGRYTQLTCSETPGGEQIAKVKRHGDNGDEVVTVAEDVKGSTTLDMVGTSKEKGQVVKDIPAHARVETSKISVNDEGGKLIVDIKGACNAQGFKFTLPQP